MIHECSLDIYASCRSFASVSTPWVGIMLENSADELLVSAAVNDKGHNTLKHFAGLKGLGIGPQNGPVDKVQQIHTSDHSAGLLLSWHDIPPAYSIHPDD